MAKLTVAEIKSFGPGKNGKPKAHAIGDGLYLRVRDANHRSWIFRFRIGTKPYLMGSGAFPEIGLADAREAAAEARKLVKAGRNPINVREDEKARQAAAVTLNTFSDVAESYITAHETSRRNAKHRQQWRNTFDAYAKPVLGKMPVATINTAAVMRVLQPIWREKHETAARLRGRIEAILDYAKVLDLREGENPARWEGHLRHTLGKRSKDKPVVHHSALYPDSAETRKSLLRISAVATPVAS